MRVTVKLIGPFIHQLGFSEKEFEVPQDTTVDDLLKLIKLDRNWPNIITRNGEGVALKEKMNQGDRIAISAIYSGG